MPLPPVHIYRRRCHSKSKRSIDVPSATSAAMQTIKNTIAENFGGAHGLAAKEHQFSLDDTPSLTDKVAIVTGGSEGIGYACTHTLLSHDISKLFILSLSQEIVDGALKSIGEEMGEAVAKKVLWYKCDMSDWREVKETADKISKNTDRIDILINNAGRGIMTYALTDYGVDRHMAVNHIGHVILTSHLLPIMKKSASAATPVRIVTTGSNAHVATPSSTKFASLAELNTDLGPNGQYGRSKLAVMLYTRYLARHLTRAAHPHILANTIHPGFVETKMSTQDIHEPYPLLGYGMSVAMKPFQKDQWEGCVSAVYAATTTLESGKYFCPPAVPEAGSALYQDEQLAEDLMRLTEEIVKEKMGAELGACPLRFH